MPRSPSPRWSQRAIGERAFEVQRLSGSRPGASAARNTGWRAARAPLVLFTDNDTIPTPALVSEHLAWHEREPEPEVGVLGHVRWAPELQVTVFMKWLEHGVQFDYPAIQGTEAGWGRFYSANASIKRELAERIGGFDELRLPFGYEDLDFAYRASELGFRLLYNRGAVADHLRPMTLEMWQRRVRRLAVAERTFVSLHPAVPPHFHRMFSEAAALPPVRGRGVRLAGFIPRSVPWFGPRAWMSADLAFRQALAPGFLDAWEEAASAGAEPAQPDVSERELNSEGRSSSGPK